MKTKKHFINTKKEESSIPTHPISCGMDSYPMRINKYLAFKQISTRKGADELVKNKKVFINGKLAILGSKVNETDKVEIKGDKNPKIFQYFAYNKPVDLITSDISTDKIMPRRATLSGLRPNASEEKIKNTSLPKDVFPVGRLDKNSHGLIILTNDGRITDKLLNPKYVHEKEYIVKTSNKLRSNFKAKMEAGVNIENYKTKPCKVNVINPFTFKVILTEGKKHQIRRMCSALFQEVADLKRIRVMNINLGSLKANGFREIQSKELETFLKSIMQ